MHTITGWVSRNLHAITMRRVRRAGPFDGYENNARPTGCIEIIPCHAVESWLYLELLARTNSLTTIIVFGIFQFREQ